MDPIRAIAPILPAALPASTTAVSTGGQQFRDLFANAITSVESQRAAAQQTADRFLSGEGEELHQVAIATQKAELSFEMFMQVRNKVVSAYQEMMRMQI